MTKDDFWQNLTKYFVYILFNYLQLNKIQVNWEINNKQQCLRFWETGVSYKMKLNICLLMNFGDNCLLWFPKVYYKSCDQVWMERKELPSL